MTETDCGSTNNPMLLAARRPIRRCGRTTHRCRRQMRRCRRRSFPLARESGISNRSLIDLARWLGGVAEFLAMVTAVSLVLAAVTLVRKARAALIEFADRPADPLTAGVARILFAASGIWYAATLTGYIELNWGSQSPAVRTEILYGHWFWIGTLVLLLLGIGGRLVAFLQLAIAVVIFNGDDLGSTVSSDLYLVGSFWLSFTRLDGRLRLPLPRWIERRFPAPSEADALPKAWPLVLLGINDGLLLLTSGISKFFDPFWIRGIGFYETFAPPVDQRSRRHRAAEIRILDDGDELRRHRGRDSVPAACSSWSARGPRPASSSSRSSRCSPGRFASTSSARSGSSTASPWRRPSRRSPGDSIG